MKRFFYLTENLQHLETVQEELYAKGFSKPQVHVLSANDQALDKSRLNSVESILRKDVIRSGLIGAGIGWSAAALLLLAVYFLGWHNSAAGWVPFVFLAIILIGFCTWEGGFLGFQRPHRQFRRFRKALRQGQHLLFIDVDAEQEALLSDVVKKHASLEQSGTENGAPSWVITWRSGMGSFIKALP